MAKKADNTASRPLAYLLTLTYFGTHLHFGPGGSVRRSHNSYGSELIQPDIFLERSNRTRLRSPPYRMDSIRREIGLTAVREVCRHRGWNLLGAHLRSTHLHSVLQAKVDSGRVAGAFKSYVSRALNRSKLESPGTRRWTVGKSARCLWDLDSVRAAIIYVVLGQGRPMSVYPGPSTDIDR